MASPIKLSPMVAPFLVTAPGLKELGKIEKDVAKIGKKIGDAMGSAGRKLTMGLTLPIVGAGAAAIKLATDANRSLATIGTLIPGQRDKLESYRKELDLLAVSSATSFETLSDGLYQSISALGDGAQAMTALKVANKGAKAGIASTKDSISLLSGVAKGYNDTSDEMLNKISDLAFTTVKLGVTTFPELAASMGKVTPLAAALDISVEQLFGNMATLTGVTGETSEVSTQLASVMGRLLKGGDGLDKQFKKMGVKSGKDLIEKMGGLNEALFALKDSVNGDEAAFAKLLGRKEAILAAFTLTGIQADNAAMKIAAMGNAIGATDEAYKEQTEGVNEAEFQWQKFLETLKVAGRTVGNKLIPILSKLGEKMLPLIDKFADMDDATIETVIKTAALVAGIGPALIIFGKLFTVVSSVVGAIAGGGGLAGVLVTLTGPVGIVIAAIAALGAAVAYFWDELKPIRDAIQGEVVLLFQDLSIGVDKTGKSFSDLGMMAKGVVKELSPVWAVFAKIAMKISLLPLKKTINSFDRIISTVKNVARIFKSLHKIISPILTSVKDSAVAVKDSFIRFFDSMQSKFWIVKKLASALKKIGSTVKYLHDGMWDMPTIVTGTVANMLDGESTAMSSSGDHKKRFDSDANRNDLNVKIKVDSDRKTGVIVKGHNAKVTNKDGAIMPNGDPV